MRIAGDSVFQSLPLTAMDEPSQYEVLLFDVANPTEYYIEADGVRSPLYRIDVGKETFWALDDAHRDRLLKLHGNGRANPDITRFKGLGEMMPKVLWETTMNPRTRRLLRVEISDHIITDKVINELMGKDPSARFRFIMERAEEAVELDV